MHPAAFCRLGLRSVTRQPLVPNAPLGDGCYVSENGAVAEFVGVDF